MPQPQDYQPGEFQWSFLLPKYWSIWIGIIFLMILAILPWAIQYRLGQWLGTLAFPFWFSARKPAVRILDLCFPEWFAQAVQDKARKVLVIEMIGVFETQNAWYSPNWCRG